MIDPDALEDEDEFEPPISDLDGSRIVPKIDLPVVNEEAAADQVIRIIAKHPRIFQRSGSLVMVSRQLNAPRLYQVSSPPPALRDMSKHTVREVISSSFMFTKRGQHGEEISASCPEWLKNSIHERGEWEHIRQLTAVTTFPAMRSDGTFITSPGYDEETGIYYEGPEISYPECPNLKEAQDAADFCCEIASEFPFVTTSHLASWLALPLTILTRHAVGFTPIWIFDAPVAGSGKTILADLGARMVTGSELLSMSPSKDSEEDRKRITTMVMSGAAACLIDNVEGEFGNAHFDSMVTRERWTDRVLGSNREISIPMRIVWCVTGNNLIIKGDQQRRVVHCRLDPQMERPEERKFRRTEDELRDSLASNRGEYLRALMTILRASRATEDVNLREWGSFGTWSAVVRKALLVAGVRDPIEARDEFRNNADEAHAARFSVISEITRLFILNDRIPQSAKSILSSMQDDSKDAAAMLCRCDVTKLSAQRFGKMLQHELRDKVVGGYRLVSEEDSHNKIRLWFTEKI